MFISPFILIPSNLLIVCLGADSAIYPKMQLYIDLMMPVKKLTKKGVGVTILLMVGI